MARTAPDCGQIGPDGPTSLSRVVIRHAAQNMRTYFLLIVVFGLTACTSLKHKQRLDALQAGIRESTHPQYDYFRMGLLSLEIDETAQALHFFQKSDSIGKDCSTLFGISRSFYALRDYTAAIEILDSIEKDKNLCFGASYFQRRLHLAKSAVNFKLGRIKAALSSTDYLCTLDPKYCMYSILLSHYNATSWSSRFFQNRLNDAKDILTFTVTRHLNGAQLIVGPLGLGIQMGSGDGPGDYPDEYSEFGLRNGGCCYHWGWNITLLATLADQRWQIVSPWREHGSQGPILNPYSIIRNKNTRHNFLSNSNPADYTRLGLHIGLGVGIRFEFNVGELLDFILGWFGLDLYKDDYLLPNFEPQYPNIIGPPD